MSDLKGSQPVDASRDFWGDLSKGAIAGTLAGTVTRTQSSAGSKAANQGAIAS